MIGTTIRGRYHVEAVVGTGAFATVYRAVDERLEGTVAVKVLAENHSLDPDVRERFISEARRLRQADGPHVVGVHDLGETEARQPFMVMELADRGDLARRVAARRSAGRAVRSSDLLAVADAVASALATLHGHRVVHRDLTPRNLLLRSLDGSADPGGGGPALVAPDERLLVGDLGLSKDLALASGLTAASGTAGFSAPEQRAGTGVDERTDVYAASALLVWLATGRAPADDGTWPADALEGWPAALAEVLHRGLATDPARRPPTGEDWHRDLRAALAPPGPAPAAPPPPTAAPGSPSAGPRRRARTLALALAVGLLVLGLTVGWAVGRGADDASDDAATAVSDAGGGRSRASARQGDLSVAIEGPDVVAVGETAAFLAELEGAEAWTWVGPDGVISPDAPSLEVTPATAGRLRVTLVATDARGTTVQVVLPARAEDP